MSFYLLENPNPNGQFYYPSRRTCQHGFTKPHLIVLHSAENLPDFDPPDMGAESVAKYATNTQRKVSWHTTIDSDSVIRMLPFDHVAWHVRDYNTCSVGYEIATRHDAWLKSPEWWLHQLYDRVANEIRVAGNELDIPMVDVRGDSSARGVTTHAVLDPSRRKDPGQAFPFEWVTWMAANGWRYGPPGAAQPTEPEPPHPPQIREVEPVTLVGPPSVTLAQMQRWAEQRNGTDLYVDLATTAWKFSLDYGVDPAVPYAVMGHETGMGHFGNVLDLSYNNWGGIKRVTGGGDSDASAHQRFASHAMGVQAVVQHVAGYAGIQIPAPVVDPRYDLVRHKRIESIPNHGWTWAKNTHDDKVAQFVHEMRATNAYVA